MGIYTPENFRLEPKNHRTLKRNMFFATSIFGVSCQFSGVVKVSQLWKPINVCMWNISIPPLKLGKPNKCDCFEWIWTWSRGSGGKCGTSEGEDVPFAYGSDMFFAFIREYLGPYYPPKCRFSLGCSTKKMINIVVVTGILSFFLRRKLWLVCRFFVPKVVKLRTLMSNSPRLLFFE